MSNAHKEGGAGGPLLDGHIVHLDVGGCRFKTYASTLRACPDGMLARMIDGGFATPETHDGCLFVDRDPRHFAHVLAYLRCVAGSGGTASFVLPGDVDTLEAIAAEADYFGLPLLGGDIRKRLATDERAALAASEAPPHLPHAAIRILVSPGGQRATLNAQGANPWGGPHVRWLPISDVVLRQRDGRCDHDFYDSGGYWSCIAYDAPYRTRHKGTTSELVVCRRCSLIDTAVLIDAVISVMGATAYVLHSIDSFPATADGGSTRQSLFINLAFKRVQGKPGCDSTPFGNLA